LFFVHSIAANPGSTRRAGTGGGDGRADSNRRLSPCARSGGRIIGLLGRSSDRAAAGIPGNSPVVSPRGRPPTIILVPTWCMISNTTTLRQLADFSQARGFPIACGPASSTWRVPGAVGVAGAPRGASRRLPRLARAGRGGPADPLRPTTGMAFSFPGPIFSCNKRRMSRRSSAPDAMHGDDPPARGRGGSCGVRRTDTGHEPGSANADRYHARCLGGVIAVSRFPGSSRCCTSGSSRRSAERDRRDPWPCGFCGITILQLVRYQKLRGCRTARQRAFFSNHAQAHRPGFRWNRGRLRQRSFSARPRRFSTGRQRSQSAAF